MKMIEGTVEFIADKDYRCVSVELAAEQAEKMLIALDALDCKRMKSFSIGTQKRNILIRNDSKLSCELQGFDSPVVFLLTENDLIMLRCCCLDSIFGKYDRPHADLECDLLDFTFGFSTNADCRRDVL